MAWVLLLLLAAMLPFELKTPVASAGPFAVTNVELVLYLGVAVWLSSTGRGSVRAWTPVHTAVCLWGAALVVCALMATAEQALVWKFTLRSLGGCALFFMVADLCSIESTRQDLQIAGQIPNSPNTKSPIPQITKSPNAIGRPAARRPDAVAGRTLRQAAGCASQ
jgi:hypothetical protein